MISFAPGPDTQRSLRDALGCFATGVTVVTVAEVLPGAGPVGITANSFASVSLDPALVLWSPARASSRFAAFAEAPAFTVHVLAEGQRDLAARFTRSGAAFDGLEVIAGPDGTALLDGVPLLAGVTAAFECRTVARHDGGDHLIVVGEVLRAHLTGGAPLVFAGGRFGSVAPLP